MNKRPRKAALEIRLLLEEYTSEELSEALGLVGGDGGEDLLAFLSRMTSHKSERRLAHPKSGTGGIRIAGETLALQKLRTNDPEKYAVLSEFENRIREGTILPTLDDFREFGMTLGKDYRPAKSRKDALGQLMVLLAQMDMASIHAAIRKASTGESRSEVAFGKLADHIITGGRPPER